MKKIFIYFLGLLLSSCSTFVEKSLWEDCDVVATKIVMDKGSTMEMITTQIGGVDYSNRRTVATLKDNATLIVKEKILTDRFNVAKTDFKVNLQGKNSKCNIVSRSVARGESEQIFKSNLIGKNLCFGDGLS